VPGSAEIVIGRFTLRVAPGMDEATVGRLVDLLNKRH